MNTKETIEEKLDNHALDVQSVIEVLEEVREEYLNYKLSESIEEEAPIHRKLPDVLYKLKSLTSVLKSLQ